MSNAVVRLAVPVYATPEGRPTCAADMRTGKFCSFLYTSRFGTQHHCFFSQDGMRASLFDEGGFLTPCSACPLHRLEKEQHPLLHSKLEVCDLRLSKVLADGRLECVAVLEPHIADFGPSFTVRSEHLPGCLDKLESALRQFYHDTDEGS